MSKLSKTSGNKINIQKLVSFLSLTANYKKRNKENNCIYNIIKKSKILGNNSVGKRLVS